jgi:hypothetical protein
MRSGANKPCLPIRHPTIENEKSSRCISAVRILRLQSGSPPTSPLKEFAPHGESLRQPELPKTAALPAGRESFSIPVQKSIKTQFKNSPAPRTLLALWDMREAMDSGNRWKGWHPAAGKETPAFTHDARPATIGASPVNLLDYDRDIAGRRSGLGDGRRALFAAAASAQAVFLIRIFAIVSGQRVEADSQQVLHHLQAIF